MSKPLPMRDAFLTRLWQEMANDKKLFFVSADFGSPVLDKIRGDFPDRFVNVGIAEQNLINVSAGLALEGYTVFAYAIAPFITMRCYEQIRVNLALLSIVRDMNVNLIGVGAGYSYVVSGPTHQCYEDITLMRAMPNMRVYSPSDYHGAARLLDPCRENSGPKYLRFDAQVLPALYDAAPDMARGYHVHTRGNGVCLVATGYMMHTAIAAAEALRSQGLDVGIIDLCHLTNFDQDALLAELKNYDGIATLEEGFKGRGGVDAAFYDFFNARGITTPLLTIGVEGGYRFELGTRNELHEQVGIGTQSVVQKVSDFAASISTPSKTKRPA